MKEMPKISSILSSWDVITEGAIDTDFQKYKEELLTWNKKFNLTRTVDDSKIYNEHFLDSLMPLKFLRLETFDRILDLGTGPGFPGVPLKIAIPQVSITLLEANFKKVRFLFSLKRKLSLNGLEVIHGRAEEYAHHDSHREAYQMVVTRALSSLSVVSEFGLPFLEIGGILLVWKTKEKYLSERTSMKRALQILGGRLVDTEEYEIYSKDKPNLLVKIEKIDETPGKYPRNVGIPEKRPL